MTATTKPKLRRSHDWPTRLHAAFDARRKQPFEWGKNDCSIFAADLVLAMTGTDLAEQWRGSYSDALGAARILAKFGGTVSGLLDSIAANFGMTPLISVKYAQRGDVVEVGEIWTGDSGPAVGICFGAWTVVPGKNGAEMVPTLKCRRAWRVG